MKTNVLSAVQLELKPAEKTDLFLLYNWSNDPQARKASFNTNEISLIEHENWFFNKLADPNSILLIGSTDNCPICLVRFDIKGSEAILSYSIDKHFRGMGYGSVLLEKGIQYFTNIHGKKYSITGFIKNENIASVKSFEKVGFINDPYSGTIYENASKYVLDWEKFYSNTLIPEEV